MPGSRFRPRSWTVIASGLLCGVLALIVAFTDRAAFFSPLAAVVVAAVGAVLLDVPGLSGPRGSGPGAFGSSQVRLARMPKYPLEPLAELRRKKVEEATTALAGASVRPG